MKTLVAYFSQTGVTKSAAEKIAEIADADIIEIKTKIPYNMSFKKTVLISLKEIASKARPELDMELPDISAYDRVLIGAPIWCGVIPNAVLTFLDSIDLSDKKAALFTTSKGTTPQKIAVKLKNTYAAKWYKPFNCNNTTEEDIKNWLNIN